MPPLNQTGSSLMGWLSMGLQDSLTVDLWQAAPAADTLSITDAMRITKQGVGVFFDSSGKETLAMGRRLGVMEVWSGRYSSPQPGTITLSMTAMDVTTGAVLAEQSATATLGELTSAASALAQRLAGIGAGLGIQKTNSAEAFENNSIGYQGFLEASHLRGSARRQGMTNSISKLKAAVHTDPGYAEAWVNLGWALIETENLSDAEAAFQAALAKNPKLLDAHMGLGHIAKKRGDLSAALAHFKEAQRLNPSVQYVAAEIAALALSSETDETLPPLIKLLDSGTKAEKLSALAHLRRHSEATRLQALPAVLRIAADADAELSFAALGTLTKLSPSDAEPLILNALGHGGPKQWELTMMLGTVNRKRASEMVIGYLRDKKSDYREIAVSYIDRYRVKEAVPYLLEATKEFEPLSDYALWALDTINAPESLPALIEALKDSREDMRGIATSVLGRRRAVEAIPQLWDIAKNDPNEKLRVRALVSLSYMDDREAMQRLADIIKGPAAGPAGYAASYVLERPALFINTPLSFIFEPVK